MKLTVGLTGGIASGKSTVGKILTGFGVTVIDADQLSRDLVVKGSEALKEIARTFGADFLTQEGELDRRKLGLHVFGNQVELDRLNAIMQPRLRALSSERVRQASEGPTPYVVYEAAILVEMGMHTNYDKLVVVSAAPELQIRRVMKRNQLTESEARDRLASQYPLERKVAVADYVVLNDNDRDALVERVRQLHEQLCEVSRGRSPNA